MEHERYIETPVGPIFVSGAMLDNPDFVEDCMVAEDPGGMVRVLLFRERADSAGAAPGSPRPREAVTHVWFTRERFLELVDRLQSVALDMRHQPPGA